MRIFYDREHQLVGKGSLTKVVGPSDPGDLYTNICTGFGIDKEVPVRAAVYALPVLQAGQENMAAQTEFYVAQAFAQQMNGLDRTEIDRNVALLKEYIRLLGEELQTDNTPIWLVEQDPFSVERTGVLRELATMLRQKGSERLIRFADSRNGDDSLAYIAAHALYMWDDLAIDPELFIIERPCPPESLLVIGGPAEKLFHEARQLIAQYWPSTGKRKTAQGFTEIGRRPPYYAVDGEPIILSNKEAQEPLEYKMLTAIPDADALRDTLYLLVSLTESLKFSDLGRIKKGEITSLEHQDLCEACKKLQAILDQLRS